MKQGAMGRPIIWTRDRCFWAVLFPGLEGWQRVSGRADRQASSLVAVFGVVFLGERLSGATWLGIASHTSVWRPKEDPTPFTRRIIVNDFVAFFRRTTEAAQKTCVATVRTAFPKLLGSLFGANTTLWLVGLHSAIVDRHNSGSKTTRLSIASVGGCGKWEL